MFIRVKPKANGSKSVQIVESSRRGDRVCQVILQHVGVAFNEHELENLRLLALGIMKDIEASKSLSPNQKMLFDGSEPARSASFERLLDPAESPKLTDGENDDRVLDGPFDVVEWLFRNMGLEGIFTNAKRDGARVKVLKQCMAAMLVSPTSKRGLAYWLSKYYTDGVSLDSIYRFMDDFHRKKSRVQNIVRKNSESLCGGQVGIALYDVTTLYFESFDEDDLRQCGYSKDNKFKETQVVLAMATTPEGLPLWYETYPGKTWEGGTLRDFIRRWREISGNTVGVVAADSGMFSAENLAYMKDDGLHYVVGARIRNFTNTEMLKILNLSSYRDLDSKYWMRDDMDDDARADRIRYMVMERADGLRVLVTWSSRRAKKNAHDRQKLIERTLKKLNEGARIKGTKVLGNRGTLKFLKVAAGERPNSYEMDMEKIERDAMWDGLRGIATDLPLTNEVEVSAVLSHYHALWRIEESFRISKSDLKIRPVYHWTKKRIEAHIQLCYLVYSCVRYLQRRVFVQQREDMSPQKLREAILDVESTIFRDSRNGKAYRLPKRLTSLSKKLYKALGIPHDTKPRELLDISVYYERRRLKELREA